jgi:hypothetical protein
MKRAFIAAIVIGSLSIVGVLGFWRDGGRIAHAAADSGPPGRYQMLMSTLNARDVFLVDTASGRIWQRVEFTDIEGRPTVWDPMPRFDSLSAKLEWLRLQQPLKPHPGPGD